jgi:pyrophosphate--fructose-6-phosphate 1-phosphotransferase
MSVLEESQMGESRDALQKLRQAYLPLLPELLTDLLQVSWVQSSKQEREEEKIKSLFPLTSGQPVLKAERGVGRRFCPKALKVGVVFSGGQAPGGHNVIVGIYDALKRLHPESKLFGFLGGPAGILEGKSKELSVELLDPYRNQGGFDLIGSGRTKIETEAQFKSALAATQALELDGLVISGDDSNTNAALLAESFRANNCVTKVIGVPKTIDGDLKNAHVGISFGFDTACKVYSEIIGNIARDALSAKKYYHFIKVMGRSASHVALECALATSPNLTLIGEEIGFQRMTLEQIVAEITDLVCKRADLGKHFGVLLIPEGLIEFIPEIGVLIQELNQILASDPSKVSSSVREKLTPPSQACFASLPEGIQRQLLLNRDPHGNVHVSLIETERLLIELVGKELELKKQKGLYQGTFFPVSHFLGYEGRAGYPSNFDCNYCYALGAAAVLLIDEGVTGYMACISLLKAPASQWGVSGVPLTTLMHVQTRKNKEKPVIKKTLVDLNSEPFTYFQRARAQWRCQDEYRYPGPIQFFGDPSVTDRPPLTLLLQPE